MNRLAAACIAFAIALAAASGAQSAPAPAPARGGDFGLDSREPIAVNADTFLADLNGETGTYTGNVIVTQGRVRLHADQVKVTAPSGRASRMEAEGHVVVDSPSGQAVGDSGVYDVAQQMLRLKGHVSLTKDANVMRGTALEVSMATGLARMSAGGETQVPGQPPGRVQGLFVPAPRAGQGSAPAPSNPTKP
jgi:lipopolysaccharide export system protein LptA